MIGTIVVLVLSLLCVGSLYWAHTSEVVELINKLYKLVARLSPPVDVWTVPPYHVWILRNTAFRIVHVGVDAYIEYQVPVMSWRRVGTKVSVRSGQALNRVQQMKSLIEELTTPIVPVVVETFATANETQKDEKTA